MGTRVVAIVVAVMVAGCSPQRTLFTCTDDSSCGAGGKCEPGFNLCSFLDPKCGSDGRSFGLGGNNSGQCVDSTPLPDGGPTEGSVDARLCFGDAPFTVCLASAPTGPLTLTTTINTDTSNLCVATTSGADGYCVLAGTTITVQSEGPTLRATGSKPLVLVASDSIAIRSGLDVSSHRSAAPETGAGADFNGCPAPVVVPTNGGGGAGGSFTGAGGPGAASARGGSSGGSPSATIATVTTLRGGCSGQDGEGAPADLGKGGHSGGAVLLIAGNAINVMASINASGEGGHGGVQNASGGGGGGAGGMIVLDARTVTNTALLLANGGGGGEGSGESTVGGDGTEPATTAAAVGGSTLANGGDGGAGSAGIAGGAGSGGQVGTIVNALRGGGGAGGGGAGLILVPVGVTPGGMISPLASVF